MDFDLDNIRDKGGPSSYISQSQKWNTNKAQREVSIYTPFDEQGLRGFLEFHGDEFVVEKEGDLYVAESRVLSGWYADILAAERDRGGRFGFSAGSRLVSICVQEDPSDSGSVDPEDAAFRYMGDMRRRLFVDAGIAHYVQADITLESGESGSFVVGGMTEERDYRFVSDSNFLVETELFTYNERS